MKSGPNSAPSLNVRGAGLFDRVDYRLIETPEEERPHLSDALQGLPAWWIDFAVGDSSASPIAMTICPTSGSSASIVDGELCGSFRLHVLTLGMARCRYTTELFGDVLHERLDRGEVFIDPARFTADPEKARRFPELPYLTVRLAYMACDYFNADTGLAMVRTDHQAFYRRVLLSETIAEPRPFPGWDTKKVVLMASDFPNVREKILTRFPIMRSNAFERRMLFDASARARRYPGSIADAVRRSVRLRLRPDLNRPRFRRPGRLLRRHLPVAPKYRLKPAVPAFAAACLHPRATFTTH